MQNAVQTVVLSKTGAHGARSVDVAKLTSDHVVKTYPLDGPCCIVLFSGEAK